MKTDRKSSRTATPVQQGPSRRQVLQGAGAGLAAAGAGQHGGSGARHERRRSRARQ